MQRESQIAAVRALSVQVWTVEVSHIEFEMANAGRMRKSDVLIEVQEGIAGIADRSD